MKFELRHAAPQDIPALRSLIEMSVRGLQASDYTPRQLEGALKSVYGVDSQLISDQTYFVVETVENSTLSRAKPRVGIPTIIGCGGWSKRKTLYGGDQFTDREDDLLDPRIDAAKIRAFFVHPDWARRGVGSLILEACETAAIAEGFRRLEMGATLTGVPFYSARGYVANDQIEIPLMNGESIPVIRMQKECR